MFYTGEVGYVPDNFVLLLSHSNQPPSKPNPPTVLPPSPTPAYVPPSKPTPAYTAPPPAPKVSRFNFSFPASILLSFYFQVVPATPPAPVPPPPPVPLPAPIPPPVVSPVPVPPPAPTSPPAKIQPIPVYTEVQKKPIKKPPLPVRNAVPVPPSMQDELRQRVTNQNQRNFVLPKKNRKFVCNDA